MRRLILFALLAVPAWPNACTLGSSQNLSTSGGHWTGTGCTGGSYIPQPGDTATVSYGAKLTVDQNWTVGSSPANNKTPAITAGYNGTTYGCAQVEVAGGVTLTLRGDFNTSSCANPPQPLTMDAGSILVFDASLAASASITRYKYGSSTSQPQFVSNGTALSPVIVTSCAAGNTAYCAQTGTPGLPAQFWGAATGSYPISPCGVAMQATYTHFSYMGDAAAYGQFGGIFESAFDSTLFTHNTLDHCGPWYGVAYNFGATTVTNFSYNVWTNSPEAVTVPNLGVGFDPTFTSGSRTISNNVFDTCAQVLYASNVTFDNNYKGAGDCSAGVNAAQTWNFNRQSQSLGSSTLFVPGAGLTNGYDFLDQTAQDNPHWATFPAASAAITGYIFDDPDDVITDAGEIFIPTSGGSETATQALSNSILIPTKTGYSNSELGSWTHYQPIDVNLTTNMLHNTWVGSTGSPFGMFQTNESGSTGLALSALKSNLAWSNGGAYCKVATFSSISIALNSVTTADYNYADSNAIQNAVSTACSTTCSSVNCANQGNSYIGNWTTTPGAHDVDVLHPTVTHPYLADTSRNVAMWDTAYLLNAAGTAWLTGTAYTVGQIVGDSHAGYYGGASINFRCIAAHTSGSTTEPNVGASWRTDWEFASLADLRTAVAAGTTYTDGAIGCAGCTAIQALVKWVQKGFTPQNPALWCAGHDGEAIGAVPFCTAGKTLLGVLGGI